MVKGAVDVFWFAFLADGLLSFLDEILQAKVGLSFLSIIRGLLALLVLLMSFPMTGIMVFSKRAPLRVLAPLVLFLWWAGMGGCYPLRPAPNSFMALCLAGSQVAVAALLLVLFRKDGSKWYEPFAVKEGERGFGWKHTILTGLAMGVALVGITGVGLFFGLSDQISRATGGYVRLKPDGIYLVERKFQRRDREVWLAGMVHIARREFYTDVLPKSDPALPSVVLVEGVTDEKKLLGPGSLRYARIAKMLRISSQEDSSFTKEVVKGLSREGAKSETDGQDPKVSKSKSTGIDFKHADVDVESFNPKTTAFLVAVGSILQAENFREIFTIVSDPKSPINDQTAQEVVMNDILVLRNEKLVSEIETSLKGYRRVIVPWGAFHLSGIEKWLRKNDFVQEGEVERKAVAFW